MARWISEFDVGIFHSTPTLTSPAGHRSRKAVIYLRQSSEGQVRNNIESQQLQYAMAERARSLSFGQVEIIDVDLGASAAVLGDRPASARA